MGLTTTRTGISMRETGIEICRMEVGPTTMPMGISTRENGLTVDLRARVIIFMQLIGGSTRETGRKAKNKGSENLSFRISTDIRVLGGKTKRKGRGAISIPTEKGMKASG